MLVAEALQNAFPVEISLPASNASAQKVMFAALQPDALLRRKRLILKVEPI